MMGFDESDVVEGGGGGGGGKLLSKESSDVSCSICLDPVTDNGDRSRAKLQCGHEFHLDCIGSAFNVKGAMQCPNCRKIEKGQWLFATGCHPFAEISFEDWPHEEDLYDMAYSEMPFGVQWCPITAFPRVSSFEDGEFPSTAYHHDVQGQHAMFAEHVPSSTHPCPYVAYYDYGPPVHSSSSSSVGSVSVSEGSNFSAHWGVPSESSEMPTYSFTNMDTHYPIWEHHSLPFSTPPGSHLVAGLDQPSSVPPVTQRSSHGPSDLPRSGSFVLPPIATQSPGARFASSAPHVMSPPYPGSAARARDRAQALQAYFQPPSTSPPPPLMHPPVAVAPTRQRGLPPLLTSSDQTAGFCVFPTATSSQNYPEAENPVSGRFRTRERDCPVNFQMNPLERERDRDSGWRASHPTASGSGSWRLRRGGSQSRS